MCKTISLQICSKLEKENEVKSERKWCGKTEEIKSAKMNRGSKFLFIHSFIHLHFHLFVKLLPIFFLVCRAMNVIACYCRVPFELTRMNERINLLSLSLALCMNACTFFSILFWHPFSEWTNFPFLGKNEPSHTKLHNLIQIPLPHFHAKMLRNEIIWQINEF